jgi:hypothetical protein
MRTIDDNKRLILLSVLSIFMCMSKFFALIVPIPLFLLINYFGKKKGILTALASMCVLITLSLLMNKDPMSLLAEPVIYLVAYGFSLFVAFSINEILINKINPIHGLIKYSSMVLLLIFAFFLFYSSSLKKSVFEETETVLAKTFNEIKAKRTKEGIKLDDIDEEKRINDFLNNPKEYAYKGIYFSPAIVFFGVFFTFWINMYLILKSYQKFGKVRFDKSAFVDFINYRTPDWLLLLLIPILILCVFGEDLYQLLYSSPINEGMIKKSSFVADVNYHPGAFKWIGFNLLMFISMFYFFQGFGVFFLGLVKMNLPLLIRSFFVIYVLLIFQGQIFVACIGLLDSWMDFRKKKFFKLNSEKDLFMDEDVVEMDFKKELDESEEKVNKEKAEVKKEDLDNKYKNELNDKYKKNDKE